MSCFRGLVGGGYGTSLHIFRMLEKTGLWLSPLKCIPASFPPGFACLSSLLCLGLLVPTSVISPLPSLLLALPLSFSLCRLLSPFSLSLHVLGAFWRGELPGGPERRPEACWGSGVMVHVLLCTDRQAQDRSFRQSRPHNPSLKHRNRQGNHWHTRHSKDEGQRGVDPIHPLTR